MHTAAQTACCCETPPMIEAIETQQYCDGTSGFNETKATKITERVLEQTDNRLTKPTG
jgi:hypothetical protein